MMKTYQLMIDTWEGQLDIDEAVLFANGVAGMFIRLNSINGGHHKDENFDAQWEQAKRFVRVPYFVYNPWVSGAENFAWLNEHMPPEAKSVAPDIEVRKEGYSRVTYGDQVEIFKRMCKTRWKTIIYTGQWFLEYLSKWPSDVDYWWAQYPYQFYPSSPKHISWDQLRIELETFSGPSNAGMCPGPIKVWQFSGDRLILPGNPKPIDVCAFFGSYEEMETYFGGAESEPPPDGGDMEYVKGLTTAANSAGGLRVRSAPESGTILGSLPYNSPVEGWLDNGWIKIQYNGADAYISAEWVEYEVTAPPDGEAVQDMPFSLTLGGGDSPYVETTVTGVIPAKR